MCINLTDKCSHCDWKYKRTCDNYLKPEHKNPWWTNLILKFFVYVWMFVSRPTIIFFAFRHCWYDGRPSVQTHKFLSEEVPILLPFFKCRSAHLRPFLSVEMPILRPFLSFEVSVLCPYLSVEVSVLCTFHVRFTSILRPFYIRFTPVLRPFYVRFTSDLHPIYIRFTSVSVS